MYKGVVKRPARAGMPATLSLFSVDKRFDLLDGYPLLTTKQTYYKGAFIELCWMLKGDTNVKYLNDNKVYFWNPDAYKYYKRTVKNATLSYEEFCEKVQSDDSFTDGDYKLGDLGNVYGKQWVDFGKSGVNQIQNVIEGIKNDPFSRYKVVTAWNPDENRPDQCAVPPCHLMFFFYCRPVKLSDKLRYKRYCSLSGAKYQECDYVLDMKVVQRSADVPLGVPINLAFYAALNHLIAQLTNCIVGELVWSGVDVHMYENQIEGVNTQIYRTTKELPTLHIQDITDINDITPQHFTVKNYQHLGKIKFPLSVGV